MSITLRKFVGAGLLGLACALVAVPAQAQVSVTLSSDTSDLLVGLTESFAVEVVNSSGEDREITVKLMSDAGVELLHKGRSSDGDGVLMVESLAVPRGQSAAVAFEARAVERPDSGRASIRACVMHDDGATPVVCSARIVDVVDPERPAARGLGTLVAMAAAVVIGIVFFFLSRRRVLNPGRMS